MADLSPTETSEVTVASSDGGNKLIVNSDGSINVSSAVSTPPTSTSVITTAFGTVATTSGTDTNYTITNAKTLTIQQFTAAAEDETGGAAIDLFYDPNGDLSVLTRIETIIINGSTYQTSLNQSFTGNGTRRIVMRRRGYTASSREVFGRWQGYET